MDDLKAMRLKASHVKKVTNAAILNAHPWFNELLKKIVGINGSNRKLTHYETILINYLQG